MDQSVWSEGITGIAYTLYFSSMDGLRVQSVALLSYIDPVAALLFSALLLREPLSALNIVGAIMIIGSAAASDLVHRQKEPDHEDEIRHGAETH